MRHFPLIAPNPPRLSEQRDALRRVEASGVFSNNGPEVRAFEAEVTDTLFGGRGASLAVSNATLGLMVAIKHAAIEAGRPGGLALMPSLTFAATAQAALWSGLTPLICDVDPDEWSASPEAEEQLLHHHGDRIGVIVPYATFGNAIDLDRYAWLQQRFGVGVVIDAASSLGTVDGAGNGFGHDAPFAVVYSMHATKTFAVAEGGLVHSGDKRLIDALRAMINFGFESGRNATLPGINAKLPEVIAILARAKLGEIEAICDARAAIEAAYRESLSDFTLQAVSGRRRAMQFMPMLLPDTLAARRDDIVARLADAGIGVGRYFSPHLAEQPLFQTSALIEPTPVADRVAARMLSLPITDAMTPADAHHIAATLKSICHAEAASVPAVARQPMIASTLIVGGGPAGTALLTAASKKGQLADLARAGLVVVERDDAIGGGRLGRYAINSDSTAQTFLTAVKDNPHPELAAIMAHPAGRAVERYANALGVPLVEAGPLLRATGDRLADIVSANGGSVLTGHEVLGSQRTTDGLWRTRLKRRADGIEFDQLSHRIVIATGGHQPLGRLVRQSVAGVSLVEQVGDKLLQSDEILSLGGFAKVADLLAGKRNPRIAVIGGSTSALTSIALLLKGSPALPFGAGGITLLHRRPLRPFYPSVEAAHAEGFTDFGPEDICPVSGFVYRLAGFRLEARELVLRMLGIDGRAPDPRIALHRITGDDDIAAREHLDRADIVVAALGYRPHALPLSDMQGEPIALSAQVGGAMVDRHCRVVHADGTPVPGVYGIGLAAGFVPWGALGGEASFSGQANGLWLWQNDVGQMIVDQILEGTAASQIRAVA
ncbi:aminotransferase DegT [Sphingomonas sp. So64.6b]|uniref:DegT/DnrJ/EryC1/StrS family aminotransferase n=1 Tax=Sphingomonas sp. So64.6b TaxID=2997354 RepID=UPI0016039B21|nr:DegT/DnrJ/EryC1/StrS family aminotransferase [Sphingomonas sp. So64.6b]QNA86230.1 aminotransferase DegT [Sphingomonas sp. So64.6b]